MSQLAEPASVLAFPDLATAQVLFEILPSAVKVCVNLESEPESWARAAGQFSCSPGHIPVTSSRLRWSEWGYEDEHLFPKEVERDGKLGSGADGLRPQSLCLPEIEVQTWV